MNLSKKILLFMTLLPIMNFSTFLLKANPWQIVDKRPDINRPYQNSNYFYLKFVDSLNGMAGANLNGAGGFYIRRTTDGGYTWKTVLMDSAYYFTHDNFKLVPQLNAISYPSPNLFIAVGDSGLILRSTDKGETWNERRLNSLWQVLYMADENYGLAVVNAAWSETTDGGITWNPLPHTGPINMMHINFINPNLFYALSWIDINDSTSKVKLIKVYNRREKIDTLDFPTAPGNISFTDENNGWFITDSIIGGSSPSDYRYSQQIFHTSDGGHIWEKQWDSVVHNVQPIDIKFYDENFGMVSSFLGMMLVTTNGGRKWKLEFVNDTEVTNGSFYYMDQIQIVSPTTAFVLGNWDYVYKYDRTLDNFDDVAVAEPPKQKSLSISPNPTTDFIEITVLAENENWEIFNVLGIRMLGNENNLTPSPSPKEERVVSIDISAFSPGVYFLRAGGKAYKFLKF